MNNIIKNSLQMRLYIPACLIMVCIGCGNTKKNRDSENVSAQKATAEVSMKPTASDEDPAWVYFTADSSGYPFTYRIKSNGTGLEKLYVSDAGPIWVSPDNKMVYIANQVRLPSEQKDTFCPKGITIWDIGKKEKKVLPFYDHATWGSGWFDNDNILYSKEYYAFTKSDCLFKQNIKTGDTSIVFYWNKNTNLNALYNNKDNCYYYISGDSLFVFKERSKHYTSFPVEYSFIQSNDGQVTFTDDGESIAYYYVSKNSEWKYVVINLIGQTLKTIDNSIDMGCRISYVKFDKSGKWIYYLCGMLCRESDYDIIKRKRLDDNKNPEVIMVKKSDEMSLGYIALGYDQ
jgi:DNA-binding beta-propeller fold protein YncE